MTTTVKFMVICRHRDKYSISDMCGFFSVSRSGYYEIEECQRNCGKTYWYRRVYIAGNARNTQEPKTILSIMQKYSLLSVVRRKKYRDYGKYLHRYPNLLNRDFKAERPNEKWVTYISYIKPRQGTLYLSTIRASLRLETEISNSA